MAQAVDVILLKFEADIKDLRNELDSVKNQLGTVEKQTETSANKMSKAFLAVGGAIAAAFSVREIVQFAKEAETLARTAEGVKIAFDKLNDPLLLTRLREATKGTVNDLVLMQTAVKAANFKLPLDQLSKLLGFAAQRARETGESVDYLVESIVLGISRKSIPILDNLGISAIQIQEEFQKTGDFAVAVGNIIDEEMSKGASATAEQAEAADRAKAEFENLKLEIGEGLLPAFTSLRVSFNEFLKTLNFSIKGVKAYREELKKLGMSELQQQEIEAIQEFAESHKKSYKTALDAAKAYLDQTKGGYENLKKIISEQGLTEGRINSREIYQERIKAIESYIKSLEQATEVIGDESSGIIKAEKQQTKEVYNAAEAYKVALAEVGKWYAFISDYGAIRESIEQNDELERSVRRVTGAIVEQRQRAEESTSSFLENTIIGLNASQDLFGSYGQLLLQLGEDQSRLAEFGKQLAIYEIFAAQAVSIANAVKLASESAKDPISYFVFLSTVLSSIAVTIGKSKSLIEATQVPKFAEGVVDLKGQGTETSDSIWAKLSRGESVITAKATRKDRGLFEAANKMQLEDYIQKNYVLPALKEKQKEEKVMFDDYRIYLAMLNNQMAVKEGSKEVVRAIERKNRRYDWS